MDVKRLQGEAHNMIPAVEDRWVQGQDCMAE